jgi:hypothetical protein
MGFANKLNETVRGQFTERNERVGRGSRFVGPYPHSRPQAIEPEFHT